MKQKLTAKEEQLMTIFWACQVSLSVTNSWSLLKLMYIESVLPSTHLILCHPLLLLPSILPSFYNESALCIRWPRVLELLPGWVLR